MLVFDLPPPTPDVVELAPAARTTIRVHGRNELTFVVHGAGLLPPTRVEQVLRDCGSASEGVERLLAVYRQQGYLLVGLRAQTSADDRTVDIDVVQGQLTEVRAEPALQPFYRGLRFDPALTEDTLVRRNILAEAYASRSGLGFRPSLAPAPQPGGSTLTVDTPPLPDFRPLSASLSFGNYGSRYVGGDVGALSVNALPGDGWAVSANYSHGFPNLQKASAGSRYDAGGLSVGKVTPWGVYGLSLNQSSYRLGDAGAPFYPSGQTRTAALTGNQLAWASATTRVSATQALTHVDYLSSALGGAYTLSEQNYNYLTVGAQVARNVQVGTLAGAVTGSVSYNLGLSGPRGTLIYPFDSAPQSRFHYWTVNLSWQQALPAGYSLQASAAGQWSRETLPANQQWVVGGFGSLQAWNSGVLTGDGGYLLRATMQTPEWNWRGWRLSTQVFAEQGAVTTHYIAPGNPRWRVLTDVGLGLTLTSPWKTTVSVVAARPTGQRNVPQATFDNQKSVYFVIQQAF